MLDAKPLVGEPLFTGYLDCNKFVFTDRRGRFEIANLDPTLQFRLRAVAVDHKSTFTDWFRPTDAGITIQIAEQPDDVPVNRIVFGKMVDSSLAPIAGALLQPIGAKTNTKQWRGPVNEVDAAVSGKDGSFKMILPEDFISVDLRLTAPQHLGADVIQIRPGHEVHNQFFLSNGTRIIGRLLHDGKPAAGQNLAISKLPSRASAPFKTFAVTSDADGRFEFANLPPKETFVVFSPVALGELPFVLPTERFFSGDNNETRDLGELNLVPSLRISGRIVVPEGQTFPAHARLVMERDPAIDFISVDIGVGGQFEIGGLPPEPYEFWLAADGVEFDIRQMAVQSTGYRKHDTNQFALLLGQSKENLQIPICAARKWTEDAKGNNKLAGTLSRVQSLRGVVVDPHGQPLGNAVVNWRPITDVAIDPNAVRAVVTDADGSFGLDNLPDQPIELEVSAQFVQVPQGWTHRSQYPARVDPDMNQQDVVIFYDSSLNYQINTIEARLIDDAGGKTQSH